MKVLICHDDRQLRRVESAIAAIESSMAVRHGSKLSLLTALKAERTELLRYDQHRQAKPRPQALRKAA